MNVKSISCPEADAAALPSSLSGDAPGVVGVMTAAVIGASSGQQPATFPAASVLMTKMSWPTTTQ
ncbi:MAG: hypothetical protein IPM98_20520 [Lewinellaceae bacterium]|nr:hypothetical protein [Lewinellaceae bacterium]